MVVNLKAQLKEELRESREERSLRLSLTLPPQTTTEFEQLHQDLGGDDVVTKPELAARLLTKVLRAEDDSAGTRRRNKRKADLAGMSASQEE